MTRFAHSVALRLGATFLVITLLVAVPLTLWFDQYARAMLERSVAQAITSHETTNGVIGFDRQVLAAGFESVRRAALMVVSLSSLLAAGIGAWIALRWRNRLRRMVDRGQQRAGRVQPTRRSPALCTDAQRPTDGDELDAIEGQLLATLDQLCRSQWLLDSVDDVVILADPDGTIRHGNAAVGSLCACCPASACERASVASIVGAPLWRQIHNGLTQGRSETIEQSVEIGGRRYPALISYRLQDGLAVIKLTDLSAYHRLKEQVEKLQALSALGEMSTELAHEIKNSIVPVRLLCDMAPLEPADRDAVFRSLDHIHDLVNDFMAFGCGHSPEQRTADLAAAVNAWTAVLRNDAGAKRVTVEIDAAAEPVRLPVGFRIVFANLVRNAIQAAPAGGHVGIEAHLDDDGALRLQITDDGDGIPAEIQDRLFEPFATTRSEGTGLGLALVQRYVHEAGGEVRCTDRAGRGTAFTLFWPDAAVGGERGRSDAALAPIGGTA